MGVPVSAAVIVVLGGDLEESSYGDRYDSSVRSGQRPVEGLASSSGYSKVDEFCSFLDELSISGRGSLE